jgi:hypothetical protein
MHTKKIGKGKKKYTHDPAKLFYHVFSSPHREALNQRNKKVERQKIERIHPEKKIPEKMSTR